MTPQEAIKRQLEVMKAITDGRIVQIRRWAGTKQVQARTNAIDVWTEWEDVDVTDHFFHFQDYEKIEYRVAPFRFTLHIMEDLCNRQGFNVCVFSNPNQLDYLPSEINGKPVVKVIKLQFENNTLKEIL